MGPLDADATVVRTDDATRPVVEGGAVHIAMEFVEGATLAEALHTDALRKWPQIVKLFVQAGRGLAAAHEKGLVHRDFKPANVMLAPNGQVKVMDFGLAKAGEILAPPECSDIINDDRPSPSRSATESLTQTGSIMGTPSYMAPEQYDGATTDVRTDQFSFCVALWRALYGMLPFSGDTTGERAANTKVGCLVEPPRGAKVPRWLRRVCERGLAADKAERFPDMPTLLAELERGQTARRRRVVWTAGRPSH